MLRDAGQDDNIFKVGSALFGFETLNLQVGLEPLSITILSRIYHIYHTAKLLQGFLG